VAEYSHLPIVVEDADETTTTTPTLIGLPPRPLLTPPSDFQSPDPDSRSESDRSSGSPAEPPTQHLVAYLGTGAVWETLSSTTSSVWKFCSPRLFDGFFIDLPTEIEVRQAILEEVKLYIGPLRELQGDVVPRYMGIYGANVLGKEVWAMELEDVGRSVRVVGLSEDDR
jgi:hypothetical protein